MNPNEIRKLIDHHKRIVRELEEELAVTEAGGPGRAWIPQQFYTSYYVISGMVIGVCAAWITLLLNIVGSYALHGDPFRLLRVYSTFLAGEGAMETNKAAVLMLTVGLHTLTGAVCGAPIHALLSAYKPGFGVGARVGVGVLLGVVMWVVNFYGVLIWLQPAIVGEALIVHEIPIPVAIANHVAFTVLVLLMQPLGAFGRPKAADSETSTSPPPSDPAEAPSP